MFQFVAVGALVLTNLLAVGSTSKLTPTPKPTPKPVAVAKAVVVPVVPPVKIYVVVSGDNLSAIAASQGLDSWRPLWNANVAITDPNLIYSGQQLVVPTAPTVDRPIPPSAVSTAAVLDNQSAVANAANYASGSDGIFARIRQRESGGNYAENTGNGYYGAYQYDIGTWGNYDGYARADLAPPPVQDTKAAETYAQRGCSPWPNTCY